MQIPCSAVGCKRGATPSTARHKVTKPAPWEHPAHPSLLLRTEILGKHLDLVRPRQPEKSLKAEAEIHTPALKQFLNSHLPRPSLSPESYFWFSVNL